MPKRKNKTKKSHQVLSNNTKHASSHFPTELTDDQPSHTLSDSGRDGGRQGVGRRRDHPTRTSRLLTSLRNESSSDVERGSARDVASSHPARHDSSDPWDDDDFPPEQPWHRESQEAGLEVNRQVGGRAGNFDERLENVQVSSQNPPNLQLAPPKSLHVHLAFIH